MKVRLVPLFECQPGMKLAKDVESSFGGVVVPAETILTAEMIDRIRELRDLSYLFIIKENEEEEEEKVVLEHKTEKDFKDFHYRAVEGVKDMFLTLNMGQKLKAEVIENICAEIGEIVDQRINIFTHINRLRGYDEYTYIHSCNVASISAMIGKWLGYDQDKILQLTYGGLLHDIGKSRIDPSIINKPGRLTPKEMETMQKHSGFGYEIVRQYGQFSQDVVQGVVMHHERKDGTGYPFGLTEDNIHPFAKIIGVADIYDAMTAERIYRTRQPPLHVLKHLFFLKFRELDPEITSLFINKTLDYLVGEQIVLSTGEKGQILLIDPRQMDRPMVALKDRIIDLRREPSISVVAFA